MYPKAFDNENEEGKITTMKYLRQQNTSGFTNFSKQE